MINNNIKEEIKNKKEENNNIKSSLFEIKENKDLINSLHLTQYNFEILDYYVLIVENRYTVFDIQLTGAFFKQEFYRRTIFTVRTR